MYRIYYI